MGTILEVKMCCVCKKEKPLSNFAWKSKVLNKVSYDCKVCHRIARKKHYDTNPAERVRIKADTERRREAAWEYVKSLKMKAKCKCGYGNPAGLVFHHLGNKDIEISNAIANGWSLKSLKEELNKCEIVCANCHAEEHLGHLYADVS